MDHDKKKVETALRYSGPLIGFLNNYLAFEIGTEKQWELNAGVSIYSKSFLAAYNTSYLTLNGKDPIYCKHTKTYQWVVVTSSTCQCTMYSTV